MTGLPSTVDFGTLGATVWDAVVVGAGPAGSLAARQLALGGARVLLVDRARFPRWKVCGACLNGRALAALESAGLGSLVGSLGGVGLDSIRLGVQGRSTRLALPSGKAVSRSGLDAALVAQAVDAGVEYLPETQARIAEVVSTTRQVRLIRRDVKATIAARVVVAASGLGSVMTEGEDVAPRSVVASGSRVGAGCVVNQGPHFYEAGTIWMAVGRQGYVGLVRVEKGELNVAAAFETAFLRAHRTPAAAATFVLGEVGFPAIDGLDNAGWQGTPGLTRTTSPLAAERLFVIGDAAGYVEPFTGEGMAWAFVSALAVAPLALRAVEGWEARLTGDWSALHDRLVRRRQWVCRGLAALLRRPSLARAAFGVASAFPGVARSVFRQMNPTSVPRPIGVNGRRPARGRTA